MSPRSTKPLGPPFEAGPLSPASILAGPARAALGPLPALDLGSASRFTRLARAKRWVWAGVATDEVFVALAVVRTGYVANAFVLVTQRGTDQLAFEATWLAPPWAARVSEDPQRAGRMASFRSGAAAIELVRRDGVLALDLRAPGLSMDVTFDVGAAPPALAVAAPLGGGALDTTEKRLLIPVDGRLELRGRTIRLAGGLGGYDYTAGLLPRHTRWRWAFGLGRDTTGALFGMNLTSGFVGAAECAAFDARGPARLDEPEIVFAENDPRRPWTVRGPDVDLRFTLAGLHAQRTRLGLVRSDFIQALGTFDGSVRIGAREVRVAGFPGVVEHQDVLW